MENGTLINDTRDEELAKWEIGILTCFFIIIIIGNSLVLFSIYLKRHYGQRKKLTRMHFFIMNLSVADLLTAVLNVLPQMAWKITFRYVSYFKEKLHFLLSDTVFFLQFRKFI